MSAPTRSEKWDPRRETYDEFCERKLREMVREILGEVLDKRGDAPRLTIVHGPTPA